MAVLELVTGQATAPGAGPTALAAFSSGTGAVRNYDTGNAWLLQVWQIQNTTAGWVRIRSPRMHDMVQGIRLQSEFSDGHPLLPQGFAQLLYAQDNLTIEVSGSAVAGDIVNVALLIYYESLKGAVGRFIDLTTLEARMVNLFTVSHALVTGAGIYGAAQAISAGASDTMKANTSYAWLGYVCSETAAAVGQGAAIGLTGVDTGNLRIGGPVLVDNDVTASWFVDLTKKYNRPMIVTIDSANRQATLFDALGNENANTVTVTSIWAELR